MLTRKTLLQAKSEASYGGGATMGDTDAVLISNLTINIDPQVLERDVYRNTISAFATRVGRKLFTCSFDVELKGKSTVPTLIAPTELHPLFLACGMIASEVAGVGIVYSPTSDEASMISACLKFNLDGMLYNMTGAYGTMTFNLTAGQYGVVTFNFTGLYNKPSDEVQPSAVYRSDAQPPIVESIGATIDSYTMIGEMLEIALNNEIVERPDFNSPEGLKGLRITARNSGGTVNPEMVSVATKDFFQILEDSDKIVIECSVGTVAGNIFDFTMPEVQISGLTPNDRNGIRTFDINYVATGTDNEITIFSH